MLCLLQLQFTSFLATVADTLVLSREWRYHVSDWNDVPSRTTGEWQELMTVWYKVRIANTDIVKRMCLQAISAAYTNRSKDDVPMEAIHHYSSQHKQLMELCEGLLGVLRQCSTFRLLQNDELEPLSTPEGAMPARHLANHPLAQHLGP
eukprot:2144608-Karenia_brevis.AAC.1